MIVKLIIRKLGDLSIWDEAGNRLFYSTEKKDFDFACTLMPGAWGKADIKFSYYQACWKNKKVHLNRPVTGYTW